MPLVAIVMPPVLPLPCVKGGAVETLMQFVIDENEIRHQADFIVFSTWDAEAEEKSKKYRYTKFCFIRNHTVGAALKYQASRVCFRLTGSRPMALDIYHREVYKALCRVQPDLCVVEGGSYTKEFAKAARTLTPEKMVLHLHATFSAPDGVDAVFPHVIAISEFVKREWEKNSKAAVRVVYNAFDAKAFADLIPPAEIKQLRGQLGYRDDDFVVLYCGRLIAVKGIYELISAVKQIPNVHLLVIGSADRKSLAGLRYADKLKKAARGCARIKFLGYIENKRLPIYYRACQVAAVPSVWEEGAGLVLLEAMACGRPLIITDSGGMREYGDKEGYIVVKRADLVPELKCAIANLMQDPQKREHMGAANKAAVQKYTAEKYYTNFINCLERFMHEE